MTQTLTSGTKNDKSEDKNTSAVNVNNLTGCFQLLEVGSLRSLLTEQVDCGLWRQLDTDGHDVLDGEASPRLFTWGEESDGEMCQHWLFTDISL